MQRYSRLFSTFLALASLPAPAQAYSALLKTAFEKSPLVRQQSEAVQAARARKQGGYAGLYPRLSADWTLLKTPEDGRSDGWSDTLGLNATQTLFAGGAEYSELGALESAAQAEEALLEDARDDVRIQLASALLQGSLAREKMLILEGNQESLRKRVAELQRRVGLGQSREPDLIQAQLEIGRTERQAIDNRAALEAARRDLSLVLQQETPNYTFPPLDALLRELRDSLNPRADYAVKALELRLEAQEMKSRSAWRSSLPALGAFASAYPRRPEGANEWEAGLRAEWVFFEGLKTPRLIEENEAIERQLRSRLNALKFERHKNLQQLRVEGESAKAKLASIRQTLERARRALGIQQADYRRGIVTELEVQTSLQSVLDLALEEAELRNRAGYLLTESLKNGARL